MSYSYDEMSTYLINMVDEAMNSTMHLNGYGGSVDKGFDGGQPPARVAPLGGRYEGSTFVPGGQVTDPTGQYAATVRFDPGWPFQDIPSMQDYYWKRVNDLFEDWYWIPAPTPPGPTPGFAQPIAGARATASALAFSAGNQSTVDNGCFGGNPDLASDLQNMDQDLDGMDGLAIRTFKLRYADPLKDVTMSQQAVACALWVAVSGEQKVWEHARQGIANIAGTGVEAMKHADGGGGGGLSAILEVAGTVGSVLGLFPGTETGVKVLSTATTVLQTAFNLAPHKKTEHTALDADTPIGVLDKIHTAIKSLKSQINGEEEAIRHAMTSDQHTITDKSERKSFDLGTPALIDDTSAGDYRTANDVAIKFSGLKFVATTIMPDLSSTFRSAAKGLADVVGSQESWKRPDGIGIGVTGPFPEVSKLASTLEGYLSANARNIDDAASILEIVARDFHKTDSEINADLAANRKRIQDR